MFVCWLSGACGECTPVGLYGSISNGLHYRRKGHPIDRKRIKNTPVCSNVQKTAGRNKVGGLSWPRNLNGLTVLTCTTRHRKKKQLATRLQLLPYTNWTLQVDKKNQEKKNSGSRIETITHFLLVDDSFGYRENSTQAKKIYIKSPNRNKMCSTRKV